MMSSSVATANVWARWIRGRGPTDQSRRISRIVVVFTFAAAFYGVTTASADPAGVEYGYDELGRLVFVSDQSGSAAMYAYDAVGNLLSIGRVDAATFTDPVVITALIPRQGVVGAMVSVFGKGFSEVPSENAVSFNGGLATVTFATPTRLIVTVPASAATGPVMVTAPLGSANSPNPFTVLGQ